MIIDKASLIAGGAAIGGKLIAQAAGEMPAIADVANLTAVSAIIYLFFHTTTKTIPNIVKDFREEMREAREAHKEEMRETRSAFKCDKDK